MLAEVTDGRLDNILAFQNSHFKKTRSSMQIQRMYSQMVATYPEKLMMDFTFPAIDLKLGRHVYHYWSSHNLRSKPVAMPITSDSDAIEKRKKLPLVRKDDMYCIF